MRRRLLALSTISSSKLMSSVRNSFTTEWPKHPSPEPPVLAARSAAWFADLSSKTTKADCFDAKQLEFYFTSQFLPKPVRRLMACYHFDKNGVRHDGKIVPGYYGCPYFRDFLMTGFPFLKRDETITELSNVILFTRSSPLLADFFYGWGAIPLCWDFLPKGFPSSYFVLGPLQP